MLPNADTLYFSIDLKDYTLENEQLASLLDRLEEKKEEAKYNSYEKVYVRIGNDNDLYEILPNGSRFHAYILHNDMYEIKIAKSRSTNVGNYPISVRVKSTALWNLGLFPSYLAIIDLVSKEIGQVKAEKISRLDLCVHTDELNINLYDIDNFSGKYRKTAIYTDNRKLSGITFGTFCNKTIMARIYNKTLEVNEKKQKLWFYDIWNKNEMKINNVWNIEFQLGRELFREFSIESVADALEHIEALWQYCTDWLTYRVNDRTRLTNSDITELWKKIQGVYQNFIQKCQKQLTERAKQLNANAYALLPQIFGLLSSFIASVPGSVNDCKEILSINFLRKLRDLSTLHYDRKNTTFGEEVEKKFLNIARNKEKYEVIYNAS